MPFSSLIAFTHDGSIVIPVTTTSDLHTGHNSGGLVRITSSGKIDSTFTDGKSDIPGFSEVLPGGATPTGLLVTPDGGAVLHTIGDNGDSHIVKVDADGKIDPVFGSFYLATFQQGSADDLAETSDGKLIAFVTNDWDTGNGPPTHQFPLARLNADGTLDPTFSDDGWATLPDDFQSYDTHMAAAPDNTLVLATPNSSGGLSLTRVETSPPTLPKNVFLSSKRTLTITGTSGDDGIYIYDDADSGIAHYVVPGTAGIVAQINGEVAVFDSAKVKRIYITGGNGNDDIEVSGFKKFRATIDGGAGNDSITSGDAPSAMYSGSGDDELSGGAANDTIWCGHGKDTMFGNGGNDEFHARDGLIDSIDGGDGDDKASVDSIDLIDKLEHII